MNNMTEEPQKLNPFAPHVILATWFGCGFLKPAPGTWGSIGALPVGIIIFSALGFWNFILAIILVTLIGYWASARFDASSGTHDNKMIVIDEVAGQWSALLPVFYFTGISALPVLAAFALFRLFDILKPWPVSVLDKKVSGALGVMGDDILAGFYAAGCMIGLIYAGLG